MVDDPGWYTTPTTGPHFIVDPVAPDVDAVELGRDDARHLATVLRARPGDPVSLGDGTALLQARVVAAEPARVRLAITARTPVPPPRPALTVVHALPRGRKLDEVVQRLTEVGVERLVPVHSARSQVRLDAAKAAKAVSRWRAVAVAAAKQSRRVAALDVAEVGEWASAFPAGVPGVVAWEESATPLRSLVPADVDALVLGIGPEGGLTRAEVDATGLPTATLGPTVLRTETAALVAATVVLTVTGRLDAPG
jgi:16S rRNA (uracil1498-N3)-methyltransferase